MTLAWCRNMDSATFEKYMTFYQQRKSQINLFAKNISEDSRIVDYIGAGDIAQYWDSVLSRSKRLLCPQTKNFAETHNVSRSTKSSRGNSLHAGGK